MPKLSIEQRFWSKVEKTPTCWLWIGATFSNKYGHFVIDGKHCLAHRVAYELTYGPIEEGLVLMHLCDNPPCINPEHLTPGTASDNMQDAMRKGRLPSPNPGLLGHWSKIGVEECQGCGTRERRHIGHGYCLPCYNHHIVNPREKERYHQATPEEKVERAANRHEDYERNRESILADKKVYQQEHGAEIYARRKARIAEDPEAHHAQRRARDAKNKEHINAQRLLRYHANPEKFQAEARASRARKKARQAT